jgi:hypothetical protein
MSSCYIASSGWKSQKGQNPEQIWESGRDSDNDYINQRKGNI